MTSAYLPRRCCLHKVRSLTSHAALMTVVTPCAASHVLTIGGLTAEQEPVRHPGEVVPHPLLVLVAHRITPFPRNILDEGRCGGERKHRRRARSAGMALSTPRLDRVPLALA